MPWSKVKMVAVANEKPRLLGVHPEQEKVRVMDRFLANTPFATTKTAEADVASEGDSVAKSPVEGDVEGDVDENGDFDREDLLLLWIEFHCMEE